MPTEKQKEAAEKMVGNGGNITKTMLEVGYSPNTANTPNKLTGSKGFQEVVKPIVEQLIEERQRAINQLKEKISAAKYRDLSDAIEKFSKLVQLLTGGDTERIGGLSDLTELFRKKADVHPTGDSQVIQERSGESTPLDEGTG